MIIHEFRDGLYQVHRHEVSAGFVVKDGKVIECAPVLRKKFDYWNQFAVWIGPLPEETGNEPSARRADPER